MPGGLEKCRFDGVCACAPPLAAAPAAMVTAAAMTLRREAVGSELDSDVMACSLVSIRFVAQISEATSALRTVLYRRRDLTQLGGDGRILRGERVKIADLDVGR